MEKQVVIMQKKADKVNSVRYQAKDKSACVSDVYLKRSAFAGKGFEPKRIKVTIEVED